MKKICLAFIAAALLLLAAACGAASDDAIGIRGEVTNIATGENTVILVEGEVAEDTMYDKASVAIKPDTRIISMKDGKETEASPEDIKLFDTVEVVFAGPVAESYPVQGTAKLVRILSK
ncbi:MAG: DUF3221 domain-containing protein [Burkholderiales bacterium]